MDPIIILLAVVTFFSTLIGGAFALRFKRLLPFFFAFAAGSLLAVTFFDILPESITLASASNLPIRYLMITIVTSYLVYSLLEKYFITHHHEEDEGHGHIMGPIGAGSLVVHSFFDGTAIGAAFQVNPTLGLIVAFAVISHDFTDGINTVTLMLKNRQKIRQTVIFLLADALAPVVGIWTTSLFDITQATLAIILAIFTGEFMYIGAVNLLPETFHNPDLRMVLMTVVGIAVIFLLTSII